MSYYEQYLHNIKSISDYFNVTGACAKYIFHRALRSKRPVDDPKYLEFSVKLQNALVRADRRLDINWDQIQFNKEQEYLTAHGIIIDEQPDTVFRWERVVNHPLNPTMRWVHYPYDSSEIKWVPINTDTRTTYEEWQVVGKKKDIKYKKFRLGPNIASPGIHVQSCA